MGIITGMATGWLTIGVLILAVVAIPGLRGEHSIAYWRGYCHQSDRRYLYAVFSPILCVLLPCLILHADSIMQSF